MYSPISNPNPCCCPLLSVRERSGNVNLQWQSREKKIKIKKTKKKEEEEEEGKKRQRSQSQRDPDFHMCTKRSVAGAGRQGKESLCSGGRRIGFCAVLPLWCMCVSSRLKKDDSLSTLGPFCPIVSRPPPYPPAQRIETRGTKRGSPARHRTITLGRPRHRHKQDEGTGGIMRQDGEEVSVISP